MTDFKNGRLSRAGGNLNATYKSYQGITIPNRVGNDDTPIPVITAPMYLKNSNLYQLQMNYYSLSV